MAGNRSRIAFVDHGFHERTSSSRFILELLNSCGDVKVLHDQGWRGEPGVEAEAINLVESDVVLFWQVRPHKRQLRRLRSRRVVWAPMRDDMHWEPRYWRRLRRRHVSVLAFSDEVHQYACKMGVRSLPLRYFPEPPPLRALHGRPVEAGGIRAFFWQRMDRPDWNTIKTLIGNQAVSSIVLKLDPDPGFEIVYPPQADLERYHVQLVRHWLSADAYHELLQGCDVFFAPRELEGIGMANLEAMAYGLCVVSPDAPTANEYLRSGLTGLLYDLSAPTPLDLSERHRIGSRARQEVIEGRQAWLSSIPSLLAFLGLGS